MNKKKGFAYPIVFMSLLILSISTINIVSYYNLKLLKEETVLAKEKRSYIISRIQNVKNMCNAEGVSSSLTSSESWNYGKEINYEISCSQDTLNKITFNIRGCIDDNCSTYSGILEV